MNKKRVSKKQKRVKALNLKTAKKISGHLVMGDQHDIDRIAAEMLRSFPVVPRLKQSPFPREREFGLVGHWIDGEFTIQNPSEFVEMNVTYKSSAVYLYLDPRGNRSPRPITSGLIETNVALTSGLARELAALVEAGELNKAREIALAAGAAGMKKLEKRTGYRAAYLALHPDACGTLSFHFGLWPVDPEKQCLIGRSAGGKRGKRGLRLIGDAFMAVLRHHRAIGLPDDLIRQPMRNMRKRHPEDWSAGLAMDKAVRLELRKIPGGEQMLERADRYQRKAAREWFERFGLAGGYQQREFKQKLIRQKEAAKRLSERINLRGTKRIKADEVLIDALKEKLTQEKAGVASLLEKNEDLSAHTNFLESIITNIGKVLKQAPGEEVTASAIRVTQREISLSNRLEKSHQENEALNQKVNWLQQVIKEALSLLKFVLKHVPREKFPKLADIVQKFEKLTGEKISPINAAQIDDINH